MKVLAWILWLFPLYLLTQGQLTAWTQLATTGTNTSSTSSATASQLSALGAAGGGP